jgi:hypothetical protein
MADMGRWMQGLGLGLGLAPADMGRWVQPTRRVGGVPAALSRCAHVAVSHPPLHPGSQVATKATRNQGLEGLGVLGLGFI